MGNSDKIVVAIRCLAFNHESCIRECLEGFVMQKTNFRFVAIVHDDASTDKTANIIREFEAKYPEIIKPIYEIENQYSKRDGSLGRIMNSAVEATGAKYFALCEGDDYWTDPYKLQKQVDYLDEHEDVGLCYTDCDICDGKGNVKYTSCFETKVFTPILSFEEMLLSAGYIAPMTWMYRKNTWDSIKDNMANVKTDGTYVMAMEFFINSKVSYLPYSTAVYRISNGSASHPSSIDGLFRYKKGVYDTQFFYASKYLKVPYLSVMLKRLEMEELLPLAIKSNNKSYIDDCESFAKNNLIDISKYFEQERLCLELSKIKSSKAYRLGNILLKPFKLLKGKK